MTTLGELSPVIVGVPLAAALMPIFFISGASFSASARANASK